MVQVLQERAPKKNFANQILGGVAGGLGAGLKVYEQIQNESKKKQALKQAGFDESFAYLPQEAQKAIVNQKFAVSKPLTSLEEAQRDKLRQEIQQMKGEDDYLTRLMGGSQEEPEMGEAPEESGGMLAMGMEAEEAPKRSSAKPAQTKFDYNDPSTWSPKQVNQFRAMEGKSAKAKSLSRMAQNEYDHRQETKQAQAKYKEAITPLQSALETIDAMDKLGKKGNLGIGTKARGLVSPQTRKHAAEYERLGKSLIQYSTNIPIRNRQEFETLAHDLYDPSISDAAREGILSAMRRIINSSMQGIVAPEDEDGYQSRGVAPSRASAQKRPLTSFLR